VWPCIGIAAGFAVVFALSCVLGEVAAKIVRFSFFAAFLVSCWVFGWAAFVMIPAYYVTQYLLLVIVGIIGAWHLKRVTDAEQA
jgi:hypothetical protein